MSVHDEFDDIETFERKATERRRERVLADCRTVLLRARGALQGVLDCIDSAEAREIVAECNRVLSRIDQRECPPRPIREETREALRMGNEIYKDRTAE